VALPLPLPLSLGLIVVRVLILGLDSCCGEDSGAAIRGMVVLLGASLLILLRWGPSKVLRTRW